MEYFSIYSSLIISAIALVVLMIIIWQYVTGRDYWGEHRNSFVIPIVVGSIVPALNTMLWGQS